MLWSINLYWNSSLFWLLSKVSIHRSRQSVIPPTENKAITPSLTGGDEAEENGEWAWGRQRDPGTRQLIGEQRQCRRTTDKTSALRIAKKSARVDSGCVYLRMVVVWRWRR